MNSCKVLLNMSGVAAGTCWRPCRSKLAASHTGSSSSRHGSDCEDGEVQAACVGAKQSLTHIPSSLLEHASRIISVSPKCAFPALRQHTACMMASGRNGCDRQHIEHEVDYVQQPVPTVFTDMALCACDWSQPQALQTPLQHKVKWQSLISPGCTTGAIWRVLRTPSHRAKSPCRGCSAVLGLHRHTW